MLFASITIAVVAIAAPLVMHACAVGRIRVNHLVGIRIASVMASAGTWRAGHRAALPATWIGAVMAFVLAVVSFSPSLPQGAERALVVAAAVVLVVSVMVAGVFANRAALKLTAVQYEEESR